MFKLSIFLFLIYLAKVVISDQALYDQCGGNLIEKNSILFFVDLKVSHSGSSYLGPKKCVSGTVCFYKDKDYAQCLYACPFGWQCDPREYDMCGGKYNNHNF
jgi:hypothetical protein